MGMGNDPVNNVDPNGGSIFSSNGLSFLNHVEVGIRIGIIGAFSNPNNPVQGFAMGFGVGVAGSYTNWNTVGNGLANAGTEFYDFFQNGSGKNILDNISIVIPLITGENGEREQHYHMKDDKDDGDWHYILPVT